jgi:uncharacterized membrane protein
MDKTFGYYIFGGLLIGALLGFGWSANGNPLIGIVIGALVGTAIGWFAAAALLENSKKDK